MFVVQSWNLNQFLYVYNAAAPKQIKSLNLKKLPEQLKWIILIILNEDSINLQIKSFLHCRRKFSILPMNVSLEFKREVTAGRLSGQTAGGRDSLNSRAWHMLQLWLCVLVIWRMKLLGWKWINQFYELNWTIGSWTCLSALCSLNIVSRQNLPEFYLHKVVPRKILFNLFI